MPILRLVVMMTAAGLGLAACGVRGDPEPPPGAEAVTSPAQQGEGVAVEAPEAPAPDLNVFAEEDDEGAERVIQSRRRTIYPPMSDSFVLDPLL